MSRHARGMRYYTEGRIHSNDASLKSITVTASSYQMFAKPKTEFFLR